MNNQDDRELWIAYYGDDFSGSTDAMESLTLAGVPTVLFLKPPTPEQLARFPHARAVGVAGMTRSMAADAMEPILRDAFRRLAALSPQFVHYKTCSTFDSSPSVGSIGRAIDVGIEVFNPPLVPVFVAAPVLGRYVAFGNLFARSGLDSPIYRLDRHPTMSRHPVTPMHEADLRLVLANQTAERIGLVDTTQLADAGEAVRAAVNAQLADGCRVVVFDCVAASELSVIGRALTELGSAGAKFLAGSSGVEYALCADLAARTEQSGTAQFAAEPCDQIVVISGSCSPVTGRQIDEAVGGDYAGIAVEPARLLDQHADAELDRLVTDAVEAVQHGQSVILHTSRGPDDQRIAAARKAAAMLEPGESVGQKLGTALGQALEQIVRQTGQRRFVVAGGDTCGYVASQLGIDALELAAPVAPGSPLCRIHTDASMPYHSLDGAEIVFKGGQVGRPDFFERVRRGDPPVDQYYTFQTKGNVQ